MPVLPRVGREVEQHNRDAAIALLGLAERNELGNPRGKHRRALGMDPHAAFAAFSTIAAAKDDGTGGTVDLRNGDHHGRLDRMKAAFGGFPFFQRLELDRLGCDVRHIQGGQHLFGRARVIVGRAADQREAAERDQRIDGRAAVLHEELLDGGTLVQARRKGRNDLQTARLQRCNHAVIMPGVAREHVGPHQQQTDGALAHRWRSGEVG